MSFQRKLDHAAELARSGRFEEAELACRRLLHKKPKSFDVLQLLGLTQAQLGRPTEAVVTLNNAIDRDRRHAGVRTNLGNALMSLGQFEEARRCFERATCLSPTNADAYIGLGGALIRLGRLAEAESALEQALRCRPGAPEALDALGVCLMKQGRLRPAMQHQLSAVQACPQLASAYVNLFNTLMFMQVTDDARRVADAGIAALPSESPEALELQIGLAKLAWLEGRLHDLEPALDASTAIQTGYDTYPNTPNLRVFQRYLRWLLTYRSGPAASSYHSFADRPLFFISESHGLSPSETVVQVDESPHRVLSILVTGCKAYHLSQSVDNEYRASVQAALHAIPPGHPVVFGFGEIDCRFDEGIVKAHQQKGVDYETSVPQFVDRYVEFVSEAAKARDQRPILYGVPAPNTGMLRTRPGADADLLVAVIRAFNDALRRSCKQRGLRLLDVHELTANLQGVADGRYHVDDYHVHPDAVRSLFGQSGL